MKTGTFVAAVATTLAAVTSPTQVAAAECSTLTLVVTLLPLLTDANTCASNTGYSLYPFTGLPTADELSLICADTTCTKVLSEAAALNLPDCTVTYDGVAYNIKDEITLYATACGVARK
ncbi:Elicitin-like protein [Phytophthora palmivora]|uniref:Elicitin n=1 Tax=Phytophthora palmivora TaxID=4796 RepID=A0A2P4YJD7_9STRA|nr:Elicitin-like protein [Phytophthora palmivora]